MSMAEQCSREDSGSAKPSSCADLGQGACQIDAVSSWADLLDGDLTVENRFIEAVAPLQTQRTRGQCLGQIAQVAGGKALKRHVPPGEFGEGAGRPRRMRLNAGGAFQAQLQGCRRQANQGFEEEFAIRAVRCRAPGPFPDLMGLPKVPMVEQVDAEKDLGMLVGRCDKSVPLASRAARMGCPAGHEGVARKRQIL